MVERHCGQGQTALFNPVPPLPYLDTWARARVSFAVVAACSVQGFRWTGQDHEVPMATKVIADAPKNNGLHCCKTLIGK